MKFKYAYHRNIYRNYIFMQIYASLGLAGSQFFTSCLNVRFTLIDGHYVKIFQTFTSWVPLITTLNILSFYSFAFRILYFFMAMHEQCSKKEFSLRAGTDFLQEDPQHSKPTMWESSSPLKNLIIGFINGPRGVFQYFIETRTELHRDNMGCPGCILNFFTCILAFNAIGIFFLLFVPIYSLCAVLSLAAPINGIVMTVFQTIYLYKFQQDENPALSYTLLFA